MKIKLKLTLAVMAVLLLVVGVYATDHYWTDSVNKSNHGIQTLIVEGYGGAGKQLIQTAADTSGAIKAYSFRWIVTATKINTDSVHDSARVSTILQKSMDGSNWVTVETVAREGKSDDTLYFEQTWKPDSLHTKYVRFINTGINAATCTAFVYQKHLFKQ